MQQVLGYSPIQTGLAYLPLTVGVFVGARGLAPYVNTLGPKRVLLIGLTLSATGMFWLATASAPVSYFADLFGPTLLLGLGQGVVSGGTVGTLAGGQKFGRFLLCMQYFSQARLLLANAGINFL
jgi:hypothetical protein